MNTMTKKRAFAFLRSINAELPLSGTRHMRYSALVKLYTGKGDLSKQEAIKLLTYMVEEYSPKSGTKHNLQHALNTLAMSWFSYIADWRLIWVRRSV